MSDLSFERDARFEHDLRAVLRDLAPSTVPASLRDAVAAVPRTRPVPPRRVLVLRPRLAALAALAAAVVLGVAGLAMLLSGGFGARVAAPSPSPTPTAWVTLTYTVAERPPAAASASPGPGTTTAQAALTVATERLEALRIPYAATVTATGFSVTVPAEQARAAEGIIGVTGDLEFVPLGSEAPADGSTLDLASHPPLFGNEGIASVSPGSSQMGARTVDFRLTPAARTAFAAYTAAHIGDYFAIVLDGTVLTAPVIQSSIPNGEVEISSGAQGVDPSVQTTLTVLARARMPAPLTELSAELVPAPSAVITAEPATPAPSTAPSPAAVIPSQTTISGAQPATGTPSAVGPVFSAADVAPLSGPFVDAPRVVAWAHGYFGLGVGGAGANTGWSSPDGRSWTPWPDGALGTGSGGVSLIGFAPCRDGAIAFLGANGSLYAASTTDGRTWSTTMVADGLGSRDRIAFVAGGPQGAVAAPLVTGGGIYDTADCTSWRAASFDGSPPTQVSGLAAASGQWVALGISGATPDVATPVAFWSADGQSWHDASVPEQSAGRGFVSGPFVGANGILAEIASVTGPNGSTVVVRSADGRSWSAGDPAPMPLGAQTIDTSTSPAATYVSDGRQILAYGQPSGNPAAAVEYWASSNGIGWLQVQLSGSGASELLGWDTGSSYAPVLLRDGILFVSPGRAYIGVATRSGTTGP